MSELSNEELAVQIVAGEEKLKLQLWQQLEKLIKIKANKFYYACSINGVARFEENDLIQEAYFAMLKAVEYYNQDSGYAFTTYLNYTLKIAFAEVAGTRRPKQRNDGIKYSVSADVPLNNESDETFAEVIPSNTDVEADVIENVSNQELHNALEAALKTLTKTQEKILRGIFYDNMTMEQLAETASCTHQNISLEKGKALEKLYRERKENNLENFLEARTNYHQKMGLKEFKNSGVSVVEKIVLKREKLATEWLRKHYNISEKKKGDLI